MQIIGSYKDAIQKILEAGAQAPSGDNSQPWKFKISNNTVFVYNIPDRDNPILNIHQSGSYVAHGGLVENIAIAAEAMGYESIITPFPDGDDKDVTARIKLTPAMPAQNSLFTAIWDRHTNRKRYQEKFLTESQRDEILNMPTEMGLESAVRMILIEDKEKRIIVGKAVASIEKVILENQNLHRLLFKDVVWDDKEEKRECAGLYINTMEFNALQKLLFRFARHWKLMKIGIAIGFPKLIVNDDSKKYASGAAIVIATMKDNSPLSYFTAGRVFQRSWLNITSWGLALQPITALFFAKQRLLSGDVSTFSSEHAKIIEENYEIVRDIFGVGQETIAMLGRIGYSAPASARSSRKDPVITFV